MAAIRAFVAIEISESTRERIADLQEALARSRPPVRWVKPDNIHLTLKFLRNVEHEKMSSIENALSRVVKRSKPFSLQVKALGGFPNVRRARVLWVDIEQISPELSELYDGIEQNLSQLGFANAQRRFSPHLTIGRVKSNLGATFSEQVQTTKFRGGKTNVDEIVLMKSELSAAGARYVLLSKFKLA